MSTDYDPLCVTDVPDEDNEYLLYFLRNGATDKCGYVFANSIHDVASRLRALEDVVEAARLYYAAFVRAEEAGMRVPSIGHAIAARKQMFEAVAALDGPTQEGTSE